MTYKRLRSALLLCTFAFTSLPQAQSQESFGKPSRVNWIVKAVRKTQDSVVTIKVVKPTSVNDVIGTGVVIDERGYVVTNYHVIRNYTRIKTYLRDGTYVETTVHATLPEHDLAVLKVKSSKKLQALRLGPAKDLMVGENVIALGHPYGYEHTVSLGIISAVGRRITMPSGTTLTNLIQTNADINPGNSGGALININGELIGINVALRKDAHGIAFAINADDVQRILSRHLSAKRMSGFGHGLQMAEKVKSLNGTDRQEVVVEAVSEETPAAQAGLREGDVILNVGSHKVGNRFDVERSFWNVKQEAIPITINRGGLQLRLEFKIPVRTVADSR